MTDKKKESTKGEKAAKGFENIAPLVGLAAQLGSAIPGLKKPKRRSTSASAAHRATTAAAGAAMGVSQTGFGASRGLALRSGLRAASAAAKEGAAAAAAAGHADEQRFIAEKDARNERLAEFGKDAATLGSSLAVGITESRQAKKAETDSAQQALLEEQQGQAQQMLPSYDDLLSIDPATGVAPQAAPEAVEQQELQEQEIDPNGPLLEDLGDDDLAAYMDFEPGADPEVTIDPILGELGIAAKGDLYRIAPELDLQHRLENMALSESYRQGHMPEVIYAELARMQNLPSVRALHQAHAEEQLATGQQQ